MSVKIRTTFRRQGSTRRELFRTAFLFCGSVWILRAADFWNRKEPSEWTPDEVIRLATKSPWARNARVLPKPGRDRGTVNGPIPNLDAGNAQGRGGSQKPGEVPVIPVEEVTVIWASAQPMIDALKFRLPADFANHYVIGINDLPKLESGRKVNLDSVVATLQLHNGTSVQAGGMQQGKETTLFSFSKELLPLRAADKEVLFSLETNGYTIRTYFNLREMNYRGKLAL